MTVPSPADHIAVRSTVYRYALGIDTRNWELYRSIFADDVHIDMSQVNENRAVRLPADVWVRQVERLIGRMDATQHLMANPLVDVDHDTALCTMYVQAEHILGERWFTIGGYYTDRLERIGTSWLVTSVTLNVLWRRGDPSVLDRSTQGLGSPF